MKKIILTALAIFTLFSVSFSAFAAEEGDIVDITPILEETLNTIDFTNWSKYTSGNELFTNTSGGASLRQYITDIIRGNTVVSLDGILYSAFEGFITSVKGHFATLVILFVIASASVIISKLTSFNGNIASIASNVLFFAANGLIITGICKTIPIATACIKEMCTFIESSLPFIMAFTATSPANSVFGTSLIAVTQLASRFMLSVIVPIITASSILYILHRISNKGQFFQMASMAQKTSDWLIGIMFTLFFGFVSVQKLTARSLSGLSFKTIRYTLSSFSLYGGSYLSKSFDLVTGCAVIMQSVIGSVGLIILLTLVLAPALELLAIAFVYRFGALIISFTGEERISGCICDIGRIFGSLFLCTVTVAALLFTVICTISASGTALFQ